jgi:hypothetical protein
VAKKMMKRIGATSAAAGIALASVLGSASAASAAPVLEEGDVWSNPTVWTGVGEDATISDAYFYYDQSQSAGWTDDAFNGMGYISVEVCEGQFVPVNLDDADEFAAIPAEGSVTYAQIWNDVTSEACSSDVSIDVSVGLSMFANAAAWVVSAPGAQAVRFVGEVGSSAPDYELVLEDHQFIESDDEGTDPSQLWTFGGDADDATTLEYEDGDQDMGATVEGDTLIAAVVLADWTDAAGAQAEANLYLLGLAPAYIDGSGSVLPLFFGTGLPKAPGVSATAGTAFSANVELDPATTGFVEDWGYFYDDIDWIVQGLPEGVALEVSFDEDGLPIFTLSGIPVTAGDYTATVWFSYPVGDTVDSDVQYPLPVNIAIAVAPAAIAPAADDVEELAETGANPMPLVGGSAALLLIGGLALVATRRRAARV